MGSDLINYQKLVPTFCSADKVFGSGVRVICLFVFGLRHGYIGLYRVMFGNGICWQQM